MFATSLLFSKFIPPLLLGFENGVSLID